MTKLQWIFSSLVLGALSLSAALASVPSTVSEPSSASQPALSQVTDDTALYQKISEIRVPRQGKLDFDQEINHLAGSEPHYRESLPSLASRPQLAGPMKRIGQQPYRYKKKQSVTQ